jgi:hypothetical protein
MILALYSGIAQANVYPTMLSLAAARAAFMQSTTLTPFITSGALSLFQGELRMLWFKQLQLAAAAVLVTGLSLVAVAGHPSTSVIDSTTAVKASKTTSTSVQTIDEAASNDDSRRQSDCA